jgi:uncharacterized membrane protein
MPTNTNLVQVNHWEEFYAVLKERLNKPSKHPTFIMYFFGIIIVLGGFGIFESIVSSSVQGKFKEEALPMSLISAMYTYFVAIGATAAVDLILSYKQRKFLLMFFLVCSLFVFLCAILAVIFGIFLKDPNSAFYPALIGYILALFLWWIGNANNSNLLDTPVEPTSPMGADPKSKPTGSLAGFES